MRPHKGSTAVPSIQSHALSIDVEDYFHVHAFSAVIKEEHWSHYRGTLQRQIPTLLDILDEFETKATFFVLGWVAEHYPALVRECRVRGHELASHGHAHQAIYLNGEEHFRADVTRGKTILEDLLGEPVLGYRAPGYSIVRSTLWALPLLRELGFVYDSSIFPIHHDYYGIPGARKTPFILKPANSDLLDQITGRSSPVPHAREGHPSDYLVEFPIATLPIGRLNLPVSGGGYFRFWPYAFTRYALKKIERNVGPFVFYLHPWELCASLPNVRGAPPRSRIRTRLNTKGTEQKFRRLLQDFRFLPVKEVIRNLGLAFWE
ncbi:MAG: DUF3473 domain-containing protein [Deltaproteobacteria bacterium]|nr:DUF3473 domain-containing protein [Deltaproteobacteria bacterium]